MKPARRSPEGHCELTKASHDLAVGWASSSESRIVAMTGIMCSPSVRASDIDREKPGNSLILDDRSHGFSLTLQLTCKPVQ